MSMLQDRVNLNSEFELKSEMQCPNCKSKISEYTDPAYFCDKCGVEINYYLK